jgi:hypothetical protein
MLNSFWIWKGQKPENLISENIWQGSLYANQYKKIIRLEC